MNAQPEGLDLNLAVNLPLEGLVTKLLDVWIRARETMSQENRDKWDAEGLRLYTVSIGFAVKKIEEAQK